MLHINWKPEYSHLLNVPIRESPKKEHGLLWCNTSSLDLLAIQLLFKLLDHIWQNLKTHILTPHPSTESLHPPLLLAFSYTIFNGEFQRVVGSAMKGCTHDAAFSTYFLFRKNWDSLDSTRNSIEKKEKYEKHVQSLISKKNKKN